MMPKAKMERLLSPPPENMSNRPNSVLFILAKKSAIACESTPGTGICTPTRQVASKRNVNRILRLSSASPPDLFAFCCTLRAFHSRCLAAGLGYLVNCLFAEGMGLHINRTLDIPTGKYLDGFASLAKTRGIHVIQ